MNSALEYILKWKDLILKHDLPMEKFIEAFKHELKMLDFYFQRSPHYFERAYYTVKLNPETHHVKALSYPLLTKASDILENIRYEDRGIYIHQKLYNNTEEQESPMYDVLEFKKNKELTGKHFPTARCSLKVKADVIKGIGAVELIHRPEGLLVVANSITMIGGDWLTIIHDWDLPIDHRVVIEKDIT